MAERIVRRVVVHGGVQGVGFRYAMRQEAARRAIAGWVRNRRDGTVEAVLSGPTEDVEAMVAWARHGPPSAQVDRLELDSASGDFDRFELHPSE